MYYTITNTIGTEVETADGILVCGNLYPSKIKAPKDGDILYAFSKAENPDNENIWRFDGVAVIDAEMFVEEVSEEDRDIMAWKTEKINIQAKIRPSKDSKKAIRTAEMQTAIADIEKQYADGDIDATKFGEMAIAITKKYM
jgi:hypothetical protein